MATQEWINNKWPKPHTTKVVHRNVFCCSSPFGKHVFITVFRYTLQTEILEADFGKNSYLLLVWSVLRFSCNLWGRWDVSSILSGSTKQ